MYKYIRVHTRTYRSFPSLKKVQTDLEPAILCIPSTEFILALWGYRPQCRWRWGNILVYISSGSVKRLVSAPGGWWRIDGPAAPVPPRRRPQPWHAGPPPEPGRGSRGSLLTEDLIRKREWLDSCSVFSTQHWAIPSQRPTHLNAAELLGYMRHSWPTTGTGIVLVIVAISTCGPGRSAMWVLSQTARLVNKTISAAAALIFGGAGVRF